MHIYARSKLALMHCCCIRRARAVSTGGCNAILWSNGALQKTEGAGVSTG